MANQADMHWFKSRFQSRIEPAIAGTPFTVDLITAIACQETGEIWARLRTKSLTDDQILALCVGDTLDEDRGRRAFPRTKAALLAAPRGAEMFAIARQALVDMARHIPGYTGAVNNPDKFCHGYGIFQRDLQFFRDDPDYFLRKDYENFERALGHCLRELRRGLQVLGLSGATMLTTHQMAGLGIAYNTGRFTASKGLKQGHFSGGKYYGELIFDYLRLAQTVSVDGGAPLPQPSPGEAIVSPPAPVTATGPHLRVETRISTLRLRREPKLSRPPTANVIGELPDGHRVQAITGRAVNGFIEVETSLSGGLLRGFASKDFLVADASPAPIVVIQPTPSSQPPPVPAVTMPRPSGSVTRRRDLANAHSLNEPDQPGRQGTSAAELRTELGAIIAWLGVEKPSHRRYQPRSGFTFCNMYAHDYCHLAGVYLPRVWWTTPAIVAITQGRTVAPLYGNTIVEMRANDLFRWLRDFGPGFGWRQAGTLDELQQEVNQGAIGLIVARRKLENASGHILPVVPETEEHRARRGTDGAVIAPLQSQAGARNFAYGTSTVGWWRDEKFAESAFWIHA